jgi:hypothetical protein
MAKPDWLYELQGFINLKSDNVAFYLKKNMLISLPLLVLVSIRRLVFLAWIMVAATFHVSIQSNKASIPRLCMDRLPTVLLLRSSYLLSNLVGRNSAEKTIIN